MNIDCLQFYFRLVLIGSLLLAGGCRSEERTLPTIQIDTPFRVDGRLAFLSPEGDTITSIAIEIAETDEARARGMMGRRSLPRSSGMFFIMDTTDTTSFWMRNTPLPLDIIFVGADSHIVNVTKRTTPYSDEILQPIGPKKYVVEVRAGFADRIGIDDSTSITWVRTPAPAR